MRVTFTLVMKDIFSRLIDTLNDARFVLNLYSEEYFSSTFDFQVRYEEFVTVSRPEPLSICSVNGMPTMMNRSCAIIDTRDSNS